jgi:hypothetical protein
MNEEEIERIVESSKRMQAVAEFTNDDEVGELLEKMAEAILNVVTAMQEKTELDDLEISSSVAGSCAGIVISYFLEFE